MPPTPPIYTSHHPTPPLPRSSLWQYHFPDAPGDSPLPQWDPSLPAYIDGYNGSAVTRGQLKDQSLRLITGFKQLGLGKGDVGCIWGLNSFGWYAAWWGMIAAGMVMTPANWAYSPQEIAHQLNDSKTQIIFLDAAALERFEQARPLLKEPIRDDRVVLLCSPKHKPEGTPYKSVFELLGEPGVAPKFEGEAVHDPVFLCYSSGTTGLPKGVMTTHYNMTSQLQAFNVAGEKLKPGRDKVLGVLPNSHIYGLLIINQRPLTNGVPVVFLPRYEEIGMYRAIATQRITQILLVPPLIITMVQSPFTKDFDLSCMTTVLSAAAPLGNDLADAFIKKFPQVEITQGYGLTETSPIITTFDRSEARGRAHQVGRIIPTWEARLVSEDGVDVADGEPGELWVRGPCVMKGYLGNDAATRATMAPDPKGEWFKTGDVLVRDKDGWLQVVDRFKELIKYKGFQVPPAELEDVLLQHPHIKDVCVIGVYDNSQATELPRAYVVVHDAANLRDHPDDHAKFDREIQAWIAGRVARHKRLGGGVKVVDAIPKTASGKILRKDIRKKAQAEQDALEKEAKGGGGAHPKL